MALITLLTDFGTQDGFVAQMKGVILSIHSNCTLIDVSHDIPPFSIQHAALVLKGIAGYFPQGTVHLAVVDPGVGSVRKPMALRAFDSYFVGPDNGLFSWIMASTAEWQAREIANTDLVSPNPHPTFHGRDIFAPIAAHLSLGRQFSEVGPLIHQPVCFSCPHPLKTPAGLKGEIIHTDRFGNVTTNIDQSMLIRAVKLVNAGQKNIPGLSRFFAEAPPGAPVALVNSFGFLEIALNGGNAASLLGLDIGDPVTIVWA
jgi:hypothetical protein